MGKDESPLLRDYRFWLLVIVKRFLVAGEKQKSAAERRR